MDRYPIIVYIGAAILGKVAGEVIITDSFIEGLLHPGKVVEYGAADKVFGSPQHEYTKALFAAAPGRHWEFGKFANA